MNNWEYKIIREILGFTQSEAAALHGLKNVRTVKRWESGKTRISDCASKRIGATLDLFLRGCEQTEDQFNTLIENNGLAAFKANLLKARQKMEIIKKYIKN